MNSKSKQSTIKVVNLTKEFPSADGGVQVLKGISFEVFPEELTIIYGPSGCGKSTILHTILGLEKPTSGEVVVLGKNIYKDYSEDEMADFRKENMGMIYQQSNWVKSLNVQENVALPIQILGEEKSIRVNKVQKHLASVGMLKWANFHPYELSSGQQQKISLARALISNPQIIIADEPTGNLDFEASEELVKTLRQLASESKKTVLMVTHELEFLAYANKIISILDGKVRREISPSKELKDFKNINIRREIYEKLGK